MNEMYVGHSGGLAIFSDDGIVLCHIWEGEKIRRYYPYGSIQSIELKTTIYGGFIKIIGKGLNKQGNNFQDNFLFDKSDKRQLENAVAFAQKNMQTAPRQEMVETRNDDIPESERAYISEAAKQISEKGEKARKKWRNISLITMIISILVVVITCVSANTSKGLATLTAISILVGFIAFIIFVNNVNITPMKLKERKSNSGTKEIVKGAVIGSIVAGDVGAVVGAVAAKNKIDNQKKQK